MRVLGRSQRAPGMGRRTKPHALGVKPKGFNIFGAFKRLAGGIVGGLKTIIVAAGNIAQKVLDAANAFPFLKKLLKVPVPIPIIGAINIDTLLKGIAVTGRITEKIANAVEVYNQTKDWRAAFKELPIADVVSFVLSPILEMFEGVLAIARAGKAVPPARLEKIAKYLQAMLKRIPPPIRVAVLKKIEERLGFKLPDYVTEKIVS